MNRKGFVGIELVVAFVIIALVFIAMIPAINQDCKRKQFKSSGVIRQLSLNNNIEANFFVFSGSIDNSYYYVFYGQNNDEIRLIKLHHSNVSVFEDIELGETPYYRRVSNNYWELHIPENTITHKIDINLFN